MHDPQQFREYLGKQEHYHNFLDFFRREISLNGYEAVIMQYLLSGSDQANDMLTRCFAGMSSLPQSDRGRILRRFLQVSCIR